MSRAEPAFRGGMIVVMTDAVGRGGKRYKLELQGADRFSLRGETKTKRYTAVSLALHALHRIEPADLLGSDALAKVDHDAIEAQLREMATVELSRGMAA